MSNRQVIGYQIGDFTLRVDQRELRRGDTLMPLPTRAFDIFAHLAAHAGTVVSSETLFRASSPAAVVFVPHTVTQAIADIRRAIGPHPIATASRRGYQLTEPVKSIYASPAVVALPRRLPAMLGRTEDHDTACAAILAGQPVTLTGASGIGKSRLATDIGWALDAKIGRAVLIDLSPLTDSASVIAATAAALGLTLRRADAALDIIAASLDAPTLLIFDGCDQVAAGVHALIEALLTRSPKLHILATNQSRLHVLGETIIRLEPLSLDAAVDLFIGRATALDRHFHAKADDPRLASICQHLDCIPAALEIAASNVALLGIDAIAQALDQQVDLRHAGNSATRHNSPRAMASWTYQFLTEPDRRNFRAVAAIPATFDLSMAIAVIGQEAGDRMAAIEAMGRLADKSLIMPIIGSTRYRMLEAPRLLGAELRRSANEDEAVMTRLATYLTNVGHQAEIEWEQTQQEPFLARYRWELDNLISVLDWALADASRAPTAIMLAAECGRFFNHFGAFTIGRQYLDRATALLEDSTPAQAAALVLRRAGSIWHTVDRPLALRYLTRSEALYRQCGDTIGLARTLSLIGDCLTDMGEHDAAQRALEEAVGIIEGSNQHKSVVGLLFQLGRAHHLHQRFTEAERTYITGLDLARRLKDVLRENLILTNIAEIQANKGNLDTAIVLVKKVITTLRQTSYRSELAHCLVNLASYMVLNGEDARAEVAEALPLTLEEGGYWLLSELQLFALISATDGRREDAATIITYVDIAFPRLGDNRQPLEIEIRGQIQRQIDGIEGDNALASLWTEKDAVDYCRQHLLSRPSAMTEAAE